METTKVDWVQKCWEHAYFPIFEGLLKRRKTAIRYREALRTQWLPLETLRQQQLDDLNRLLTASKRSVPYFRDDPRYPASVESLGDLEALPITGKAEIRAAGRTMLAEGREDLAWWKSTGGSTGEPLSFAHDKTSHEWRTAMSLRGYGWAGAHPGTRQAYIWGVPTTSPGVLQQVKEHLHHRMDRRRFYNCFNFGPQEMARCHAELSRWKPDAIIGYTNPTYEFARFIEASGLAPLRVRSVLCAAEKVHPSQRDTLERVFGADVYDTYGSREFMLIASECTSHRGLHVSMENLIVEIVDDAGRAVPPGQTGRIIVTDLHNFTMPFIRYEIGDLATPSAESCSCGRQSPLLEDIVGRSLDVIRTPEGQVIPGELFPHLMKDYPAVQRFRVVQEPDYSLTIMLRPAGELAPETVEDLRRQVERLTGCEMNVDIRCVDEIPLTPSGKHRVTVSRLEAAS